MLAGSLCLLPFLLPYHQPPILSFFPEWLAAGLGVAAALALLVGRGVTAVFLPAPARWLIAFAALLAAQAASGGHYFFQIAPLRTPFSPLRPANDWAPGAAHPYHRSHA